MILSVILRISAYHAFVQARALPFVCQFILAGDFPELDKVE